MPVSRRSTLKGLGAAGAAVAMSGQVFAKGEYEDDERNETASDDEKRKKGDTAGAAVRVAHFSPDAPNVDVYVDGNKVISDLAYDDVSPYLEIDPGTYTVQVTAAGDPGTVAFEGDVTFGPAFYTVAAIGELEAGTFEPLVLVDAGAALVRLVHASPDAPAVDVVPADAEEPLFANVSFGDATDYVPLPTGSYTLEVRPAGGTAADAVTTLDVDLAEATAYTAYAVGYLEPPAGREDRPFAVNVTVDGPMADAATTRDDSA